MRIMRVLQLMIMILYEPLGLQIVRVTLLFVDLWLDIIISINLRVFRHKGNGRKDWRLEQRLLLLYFISVLQIWDDLLFINHLRICDEYLLLLNTARLLV